MRTAILLLTLALALRCHADGPLSPSDALASFKLEPTLRAELVAAEPLTASPCALAWDERGRLFVAENRGYPTGSPDGRPLGVIALLEDTDGDGRADKRTVFADGLTFPNGLTPWRGGLIVTCAPDVLWLADTNGDGRADVRRVLLTGFSTNGSTQLRVSSPTLGPDGWIWLTCGLSGANITCPEHPERPALKTTTDARFHPDTLEVEAVDGRGQFGQTFDDFGRRFICMNRVQVQHVVMPSRFLKRNPNLAFTDVVQNCPDLLPNPLLKGGLGAARIYPISANVTTADSHAGTFTAACAVHIFRGDALPGYRGRAFSCDPTANLVHWDDLIPTGATFAARRSSNQVEFLASTDNWFRPVFLATGPDGALYVADMYRGTIEHPDYLPVEVRKRTDFEGGKGMGRIWRVLGTGEGVSRIITENRKKPDLSTATSEQLTFSLSDQNGWRRDAAFRLLVELKDKPSVEQSLHLQAMSPNGWASETRALALRLLAIYDKLGEAALLGAFKDRRDGLTEVALELSGPRFADSSELQSQSLERLAKPTREGLWALHNTGSLPYEQKREALRGLLRYGRGHDRWHRAALLGSLNGQTTSFLRDIARAYDQTQVNEPAPWSEMLPELARLSATEATLEETRFLAGVLADYARWCFETDAFSRLLLDLEKRTGRSQGDWSGPRPQIEWELPILHGFAGSFASRPANRVSFTELISNSHSWYEFIGRTNILNTGQRVLSNSTQNMLAFGTNISALAAVLLRCRHALTNSQPLAVQVAAAALLAEGGRAEDRELCLQLFTPARPPEIQRAAAKSFVRLAGTNAAPALLAPERWRVSSPALRETALAALFADRTQLPRVLDAVESATLPASALDTARRTQLLKHKDDAIRTRAEALFKQPAAADRMRAYEASKAALTLAPHAATGREVFQRACANCHRLDRAGVAVGPDLFDVRNQPKETLLLHIIVPEFEIAPNFTGYTLETRDGRTLSGLIAGETPASVTLRQALGVEETVLRANIASLEASRLSIMPQEIEKTMSTQDLADLLAYLKGEK